MKAEGTGNGTPQISASLAERIYKFLAGIEVTDAYFDQENKAAKDLLERSCCKHHQINSNGQDVYYYYEDDFFDFLCKNCTFQVECNSMYGDSLPALLYSLQEHDEGFDIAIPNSLQTRIAEIEEDFVDPPEEL